MQVRDIFTHVLPPLLRYCLQELEVDKQGDEIRSNISVQEGMRLLLKKGIFGCGKSTCLAIYGTVPPLSLPRLPASSSPPVVLGLERRTFICLCQQRRRGSYSSRFSQIHTHTYSLPTSPTESNCKKTHREKLGTSSSKHYCVCSRTRNSKRRCFTICSPL